LKLNSFCCGGRTADARIADALLAMGAKMDFISAVTLGRTGLVQAMLDDNPSLIRKHSPGGWTALHVAAGYAPTETVALLISAGADVNSLVSEGSHPCSRLVDGVATTHHSSCAHRARMPGTKRPPSYTWPRHDHTRVARRNRSIRRSARVLPMSPAGHRP
jgi:hypothetical protein